MEAKKAVVIGAGIAGLAAAIRLAIAGYQVSVYESNAYAGGKLAEFSIDNFRFDAGPSLFTMPQYVDELFHLAGKNPRDYYQYETLKTICHYFYASGNRVKAYADTELLIKEFSTKFNEPEEKIVRYFKNSAQIYQITEPVFLSKSLHLWKSYFNKQTLKSALKFHKIDAFRTQHRANASYFKNPELVQLFDRYASYNGSNPYQAPATLNVIPHFEYGFGAYFPKHGMFTISNVLLQLAKDLGVVFHFGKKVKQIMIQDQIVKGIMVDQEMIAATVVFSNVDIYFTYQHLLNQTLKMPSKIKKQERSSSALIFYWGMNAIFKELNLHNIFFAADYKAEFEAIFKNKNIYHDPTIYLNITSKLNLSDAPKGSENWFVMINVPNDAGQNWEPMITQARKQILEKLSNQLGVPIEDFIQCERVLHPKLIQEQTGSYLGSLYGSSSNNPFAAFLRHPNFLKKIKHLYFCGGSVHPGGGIPLALLSAKIAVSSALND